MIPYRMNPLGIRVNEVIPLTVTAAQANSTVKLTATGSPTVSGLHYRLGKSGAWLAYTIGNTITLTNVEDSVQFWNSASSLSSSTSNFVQFSIGGKINAYGNIQSLLNYTEMKSACFTYLFAACDGLYSAPDISASILKYRCLWEAFKYTRISSVKLAAETLEAQSLYRTFLGCSFLNRIEVDFTSWGTNNIFDWVSGVASSGTFIKPAALSEEYGTSRIPSGWTVVNK